MLHKYLIIRFIIYDIVRSNFSLIYVFLINMRAQRKYAIFLAMRPLLVLLIIFTQKNIVDNSKRRKMIEVCYLQKIRFP